MLEGFDGSNWTRSADMIGMRRQGMVFAVWKSSQGMTYTDPTFPAAWAGMHKAGLIRGAYHFFEAGLSGAAQAHLAHTYVHEHGGMHGHDFVALDLEWPIPADPAAYIQHAEQFVEYVLRSWRRQCVIYTDRSFWQQIGSPKSPILAACPLWSADWGVVEPLAFDPWPVVSFWQYRGNTPHANAAGPIDLDRFNGTHEQLLAVTTPRG